MFINVLLLITEWFVLFVLINAFVLAHFLYFLYSLFIHASVIYTSYHGEAGANLT